MFESGHPGGYPPPHAELHSDGEESSKHGEHVRKEKKDEIDGGKGSSNHEHNHHPKIHMPFRGHKRSQSHGNGNKDKEETPPKDKIVKHETNGDSDTDEDAAALSNNRSDSSPHLGHKQGALAVSSPEKIKKKANSVNSKPSNPKKKAKTEKARKNQIELTTCYKFEKVWDDSKTGAVPFEISIYR